MRCFYCEAQTEEDFSQCPNCGLWFSLKEQMLSWDRRLEVVIECLQKAQLKHYDCAEDLVHIRAEIKLLTAK